MCLCVCVLWLPSASQCPKGHNRTSGSRRTPPSSLHAGSSLRTASPMSTHSTGLDPLPLPQGRPLPDKVRPFFRFLVRVTHCLYSRSDQNDLLFAPAVSQCSAHGVNTGDMCTLLPARLSSGDSYCQKGHGHPVPPLTVGTSFGAVTEWCPSPKVEPAQWTGEPKGELDAWRPVAPGSSCT